MESNTETNIVVIPTEEEKIYKYKDYEFKHVKRNLKFRKDNYKFLKKLVQEITVTRKNDKNEDITEISEDLFFDFIHDDNNILQIFKTFLDGDTSVIDINSDEDEDYHELVRFVTEILTDFFSSFATKMNKSNT